MPAIFSLSACQPIFNILFPNLPSNASITFPKTSLSLTNFPQYLAENPVTLDQFSPISSGIARAVRYILGVTPEALSDGEALEIVLDPNKNPLLAQVNGDIVIDHLSQSLNQAQISAVMSLSHTANYQLQRHRALDHTTPLVLAIPKTESDYVIPTILNSNQEALIYYLETLANHSQTLQDLSDQGVSLEHLQYLLPNAVRVQKSVSDSSTVQPAGIIALICDNSVPSFIENVT